MCIKCVLAKFNTSRVFTSLDCITVISLRTNLLPIHISLVFSLVLVNYVHCKYPVTKMKNVREINLLSIQFPDMFRSFVWGHCSAASPGSSSSSWLGRVACPRTEPPCHLEAQLYSGKWLRTEKAKRCIFHQGSGSLCSLESVMPE